MKRVNVFSFFFLLLLLRIEIILGSPTTYKCQSIKRTSIINEIYDAHPYYPMLKRINEFRSVTPLTIDLHMGPGLRANSDAATTFITAAQIWTELLKFTNADKININVDLRRLDTGILGSTETIDIHLDCADAASFLSLIFPENGSHNISLPTCQNIKFDLPNGIEYREKFNFNKANLKGLGLKDLDYSFGESDGSIKFNTRYLTTFDFYIADGIDTSKVDFLTVAIHEMGHVLGFKSGIDEIDFGSSVFYPTLLDLYRFTDQIGGNNFLSSTREANPYVENHIFFATQDLSFIGEKENVRFSTGVMHGDGNQASHWRADEISGYTAGIMDPSMRAEDHISLSMNDVTAMRALGYSVDLAVNPRIYFYKMIRSGNAKILAIYAEFMFSSDGKCVFSSEMDSDLIYDKDSHYWKCRIPSSENGNSRCDFKITNKFSYSSQIQHFNC